MGKYVAEKLIEKWEKTFEKKMTPKERNMFLCGLEYGIDYITKILNKKCKKKK